VLEEVTEGGEYRRAVYLEGQPALITVCNDDAVETPRLTVSVTAARLDETVLASALRTVERVFATTPDLTGLEETFANDSVLWPVWLRFRGLRPAALPDLFESIVWAITGQQITVAFAAKCKEHSPIGMASAWRSQGMNLSSFRNPRS